MIEVKILVCYDGSESSLRAVGKAHHLIKDCGIHEVTLIHAYTEHSREPIAKDKFATPPALLDKLKDEEKKNWLKKQETLEEIAERFTSNGAKTNIRLEHGKPAKVIIKEAEGGDYDIIVLGKKGKGAIKNMVMGSVSNSVIQGTDVSVLVVQ